MELHQFMLYIYFLQYVMQYANIKNIHLTAAATCWEALVFGVFVKLMW